MFARLVAKLFGTAPRTPIRRTRLNAEMLEAREVPALVYWQPQWIELGGVWFQDTDATDAENWHVVSPVVGHAVPTAGDDVRFEYVHAGSNADCVGFGLSSGSFDSVRLDSGYTATVTLASGFETEDLYLASGAISQPASGTDITVTENFEWGGGVLNSSAYTATVTVSGSSATATITPPSTGGLETGSHLTFDDNATGTFGSGTVTFKNDADLNIEESSFVSTSVQNPTQPAKLAAISVNKNEVFVRGGATLGNTESELPIYVAGGTLSVPSGTTLKAKGDTGVFGSIPNVSVYVWTGALVIDHGGILEVTNGLGVLTGKLATRSVGTGAQSEAKIIGNVTNKGADVVIGDAFYDLQPGMAHRFGVLLVDGTVSWSGGTYRPAVRANNPGESDVWKSTGTFTVYVGAAFAPGAVNAQGQPTGYPPTGQSWKILESVTEIVGATPNVPGGWTLTRQGIPVKIWNVVS